jgi:CBS domain-containing protein
MPTAREIMTPNPTIVKTDASVADIAKRLRDEDIGAVIVCNEDNRIEGLITDRDIAVEIVAGGKDASGTKAGDLLSGMETVTIGADDDVREAVRTMKDHAVRRLPVIDGDRVIGMVSLADLARSVDDELAGELLRTISEAPDNSGQG